MMLSQEPQQSPVETPESILESNSSRCTCGKRGKHPSTAQRCGIKLF